jgi:hypothetical protein
MIKFFVSPYIVVMSKAIFLLTMYDEIMAMERRFIERMTKKACEVRRCSHVSSFKIAVLRYGEWHLPGKAEVLNAANR